MDIALIENSNPFAIITDVDTSDECISRITTAISEHLNCEGLEIDLIKNHILALKNDCKSGHIPASTVRYVLNGQKCSTFVKFSQTWVYSKEEQPKGQTKHDQDKTAWDFVEKHYEGYYHSNDIALANDLQKLMDGEWDEGDGADQIRIDNYGDRPDPEESLQCQSDYYEVHNRIYEQAIEDFLNNKPKFKSNDNPAEFIKKLANHCGIDFESYEVSIINRKDVQADVAELLTQAIMEEKIWIEDPETNDGSMILTDGAQDEYNRIFDEIEELFL